MIAVLKRDEEDVRTEDATAQMGTLERPAPHASAATNALATAPATTKDTLERKMEWMVEWMMKCTVSVLIHGLERSVTRGNVQEDLLLPLQVVLLQVVLLQVVVLLLLLLLLLQVWVLLQVGTCSLKM